MKLCKVGSSFLEEHSNSSSENRKVYNYAKDRKPIITPVLTTKSSTNNNLDDNNEQGLQYILIPNKDHILVLSMEHGQMVCKMEILQEKDEEGINRKSKSIQSATILKQSYDENDSSSNNGNQEEWVVVAGLSDGTLQEWKLDSIPMYKGKDHIQANRIFTLPDQFKGASVSHITSPVGAESGILYALVTSSNKAGENIKSDFLRINVPKLQSDENGIQCLEMKFDDNINILAKFRKNGTNQSSTTCDSNKNAKEITLNHEMPFSLISVSCERKGAIVNYIVMTSNKSMTIYYENMEFCLSNKQEDSFVHFSFESLDKEICAAAVAPNGQDVALGFTDGKIDILVSVLNQCAMYIDDLSSMKTHPKQRLLKKTIHWHSLPVSTLRYLSLPGSRASPSLLSGGEESVLVTWNVERELKSPSHTLPRIAKGGITHIATNTFPLSTSSSSASSTGMDIIVRCMDNTLQLVQGHNHAIRWKIQGLATQNNEFVEAVSHRKQVPTPVLQVDPRTQTPVLTRLAGAPGFIHWYDLNSNQVVGELEVAPYNRISRKESHHNAYPRPMITNFVMNSSGTDLITVDTMLTENNSVGKGCRVNSYAGSGDDLTEEMSLVTNIKFWNFSRKLEKEASKAKTRAGMPYELISAMPNPHGAAGEIDALAIAPLGIRACTLSKDEGAFHIWGKGKSTSVTDNSLSPLFPSWKRLCKITIPSGYSNSTKELHQKDCNNTAAFSSDGSVLIIALGRHITIWDHSNATLLNTLQTQDHLSHVQFIRSPLDMVLTVGQSSVSVLAPFGSSYLGNDSWSYNLPKNSKFDDKSVEVNLVTVIMSRKELAVAMKVTESVDGETVETSKIILVDSVTGKAKTGHDGKIIHWDIDSKVLCLCDISQAQTNWASKDAVLLVLTGSNEIIVLNVEGSSELPEKNTFYRLTNKDANLLSSRNAPRIKMGNKRRSSTIAVDTINSSVKDDMVGKGSLLYDSAESTSVLTSQLPALTSTFAQSFLSRKLKKFKSN